MIPTAVRRDVESSDRSRRYTWLLALVLVAAIAASLSITYTLYRTAQKQWIARAGADAQRLSSILLGWMDDSFAPISGLAALLDNSQGTEPEQFLNAFEGIESRTTTGLLGAVAMLRDSATGHWVVVTSSGNFAFLEMDAANGLTRLQPLIALAVARPNQFVLGAPVSTGDEQLISPVLIALTNVRTPTILVGKIEYASLPAALLGASTPTGFYLSLSGQFMDRPNTRSILQARPNQPVLERIVTRAAMGGADLEIVWGVSNEYANGPDYAAAATTLAGSLAVTLLFGLFMAGLIRRNRVINERVDQATAALRLSSEEQTAILESATLGIAFVKDRVIIRANSRLDELFGFEHGEQIGRPTRIWYPDDESYALGGASVYQALARGETHQREQRLRRKNGELFWCRLSGRTVQAGDLSRGTVWMLEDVTARRQTEAEIRQARHKAEEATEMKSLFLANMSHEIRTPMNAIIGLSHLTLKTPLTVKQRDYVTKVHNAGTSLLGIINDILDFSKIEAGKLDLETIDFTVDDVITSVTTLTAQKAHDKGLEFLASVSPAVPDVLRGDPLRLGQVLTNLVNNAVKFTERGVIRLRIDVRERIREHVQLECSVEDTGIGMTTDQAAKLFQPFTQADMSTTRNHGGTGLGLSIVRRLVELMGGHIWLESEPDVGTTFHFVAWFELGAAFGAHRANAAEARVTDEQAGRLRGMRILLVEDNEINQQIATELLESAGASVRSASDGREAVHTLSEGPDTPPFDIVLMDLQMPVMDGFQSTAKLRTDRRFASLPIVAMTAHATLEERQRCLAAGMDDHIAKPIDPAVLIDTVARYHRVDVEPGEHIEPRHRDASALPSVTNAVVPSVAGLDTADGLLRVAGNRNLYVTLLRQFVEGEADAPERIAEALGARDLATAERVAHTVSGTAGNLGAGSVQTVAAVLAQAIRSETRAGDVENLRHRFADELAALINHLRPMLARDAEGAAAPTTVTADPEAFKRLVGEMRKYLDEFDPSTVDVLERHHKLFQALLGEEDFTAFERHVRSYAFAEAQPLLERALARWAANAPAGAESALALDRPSS